MGISWTGVFAGALLAVLHAPPAMDAGTAGSQAQTRPAPGGQRQGQRPDGHEDVDRSKVRGQTFEETRRWIEQFERPERDAYQQPDRVVQALKLQPGQAVADLGAGSGYFTFRLARAVGSGGRVYAIDIEPGFIQALEERGGREEGGEVVQTVLAQPDDARLAERSVDLVLIVKTYHHISSREAYLEALEPALRAGGRVAVVDYREGELPVGPPPGHKLSRAEVIAEFEAAGYGLEEELEFLPYQYFLIFSPRAGAAD